MATTPQTITDRVQFFNKLRTSLFTSFTQLQVDSINAILDECELQGVTDKKHVAYILATPYHECYNPKTPETRLTPIKEFGSLAYLQNKPYWPYIGRGFSGCTWLDNYKKTQKYLKTRGIDIDLVNNPDLLLNVKYSAMAHVYAMRVGMYTGKKLSDFTTFVPMRAIINGTDKASLIASYANGFLTALT